MTDDYMVIETERRTVEIAVHPDGNVVVRVPVGCPAPLVRESIERRARWIQKKKTYFEQFQPRTPPRQYLAGETHLYLGKQYRLRLVEGPTTFVQVEGPFLLVQDKTLPLPPRVSGLLKSWYRGQADEVYHKILEHQWQRHHLSDYNRPRIVIRKMTSRWGSLTSTGTMTLNINLIRTPLDCIEFVVCHELCHLLHLNHSPAFYKLMSERMPDWKERKIRLEQSLF